MCGSFSTEKIKRKLKKKNCFSFWAKVRREKMSLSPSRERPCKFDVMRSLSFAEGVFGCVRSPRWQRLVSHNKKNCAVFIRSTYSSRPNNKWLLIWFIYCSKISWNNSRKEKRLTRSNREIKKTSLHTTPVPLFHLFANLHVRTRKLRLLQMQQKLITGDRPNFYHLELKFWLENPGITLELNKIQSKKRANGEISF